MRRPRRCGFARAVFDSILSHIQKSQCIHAVESVCHGLPIRRALTGYDKTASRPFWSRVGTCSAPRVMLGRPRLRLIVMPGTVTVALARPGHVTFPRCSSRTSWATGSPGATGPNLWGSNKGPPRLPEPPPPCDSFALSARSPDSAALIDHSRHGPHILDADWITTSRRC